MDSFCHLQRPTGTEENDMQTSPAFPLQQGPRILFDHVNVSTDDVAEDMAYEKSFIHGK